MDMDMEYFRKELLRRVAIVEWVIIGITIILMVVFIYLEIDGKPAFLIIIALVALALFFPTLTKIAWQRVFEKDVKYNKSRQYVLEKLSTEYCEEVVPISMDTKSKKLKSFICNDLVERARFFAYRKNNNTVCIAIQFYGEEEMWVFEEIDAIYFTTRYKIV